MFCPTCQGYAYASETEAAPPCPSCKGPLLPSAATETKKFQYEQGEPRRKVRARFIEHETPPPFCP